MLKSLYRILSEMGLSQIEIGMLMTLICMLGGLGLFYFGTKYFWIIKNRNKDVVTKWEVTKKKR